MTLSARLRRALDQPPVQPLLEGDLVHERAKATVPAAVLMAVADRPQPSLLLTVRHADLRTHAGQIAFPGGRVDPGEDAVAAALREAQEEIGLDPSVVEVIGAIEPYRTVTGYVITPVLAAIPAEVSLHAHEPEVADWFEAPLDFLLDPGNHKRASALFHGQTRHYYEIVWRDRRIWGATAAMIINLSRRLQWH